MKNLIVLWCLFFLSITDGITQSKVSGHAVDKQTKEPLAFATVAITGTSIGTLTNGSGFFELKIPETLNETSVVISFLGYEPYQIAPSAFGENLMIAMKQSVINLAAVTVRPLKPEDYIQRATRNIKQVLGKDPYGGLVYYREKFKENGAYLGFTEGVFQSYYPAAEDTLPNQYQLMLYETVDNPAELQFMRESMAKKDAKKERKAIKKGEEYEAKEDMISASFGGPEDIISMDLRNDLETFLDSTKFKKFRYSFAPSVMYQDRELMVINFETKGTVEFLRTAGKIYIDPKSNAFAAIEYEGDFVIPFFIEPILFAAGFSISNPYIKKKLRYQLVDGNWYPEYFYIHLDIALEKRHFFDPNERSKFEIEQLLRVNEILPNGAPIPEEKQFSSQKDAIEQIYNDLNLEWEDINTIKDEQESKS